MYDTITIAPVHTGWWFLLLLVIPIAVSFYVWLSVRMNSDKMSNAAGYLWQCLVVFGCGAAVIIALAVPMFSTPEIVANNQQAAMASQLNYKHISISYDHDDKGFTASTEDGKYVSGVLLDNGDNVYTIKYTVAP